MFGSTNQSMWADMVKSSLDMRILLDWCRRSTLAVLRSMLEEHKYEQVWIFVL